MSQPKPWFRKQTRTWYVQIGNKQTNLGRNKSEAFKKYYLPMVEDKSDLDSEQISIQSLCSAYLSWCGNNLAVSTLKKNRFHIQRFMKHVDSTRRVSGLKPLHIQDWIDSQYKNSSSTYKHTAISVIQAAFRWAVESGHIDQNPIARMKRPRSAIREFYVPKKSWNDIVNALKAGGFRDLVIVMLHTGARPQEIRKIEARHFDSEFSRIVFLIGESKGRRRSRTIYLDAVSLRIVQRLCKTFPIGPIFRNSRNEPWTADALGNRFRRLRRKLGLFKLTAYSLRHSYSHRMLTNGVDSHIVSKLLGHVDGRMLFNCYGHLEHDPAFLTCAANKIAESDSV